jgi:hypothetical protein
MSAIDMNMNIGPERTTTTYFYDPILSIVVASGLIVKNT